MTPPPATLAYPAECASIASTGRRRRRGFTARACWPPAPPRPVASLTTHPGRKWAQHRSTDGCPPLNLLLLCPPPALPMPFPISPVCGLCNSPRRPIPSFLLFCYQPSSPYCFLAQDPSLARPHKLPAPTFFTVQLSCALPLGRSPCLETHKPHASLHTLPACFPLWRPIPTSPFSSTRMPARTSCYTTHMCSDNL